MSTRKGKKAEDVACAYLKKHGYEIIERNKRLGRGELDIVALQEDVLVFIEVKAHQQRDASLLAMHPDKCDRFVSAANTWLGLNQDFSQHQCRFDLVIVTPRKPVWFPNHVEHMLDVIRL